MRPLCALGAQNKQYRHRRSRRHRLRGWDGYHGFGGACFPGLPWPRGAAKSLGLCVGVGLGLVERLIHATSPTPAFFLPSNFGVSLLAWFISICRILLSYRLFGGYARCAMKPSATRLLAVAYERPVPPGAPSDTEKDQPPQQPQSPDGYHRYHPRSPHAQMDHSSSHRPSHPIDTSIGTFGKPNRHHSGLDKSTMGRTKGISVRDPLEKPIACTQGRPGGRAPEHTPRAPSDA
jgi:hypothetical protein